MMLKEKHFAGVASLLGKLAHARSLFAARRADGGNEGICRLILIPVASRPKHDGCRCGGKSDEKKSARPSFLGRTGREFVVECLLIRGGPKSAFALCSWHKQNGRYSRIRRIGLMRFFDSPLLRKRTVAGHGEGCLPPLLFFCRSDHF